MPTPLSAAHLRRWADDLDAEDRAEKEAALEQRVDRIEEGNALTEAERTELVELRHKLAALEEADDREADDEKPTDEIVETTDEPDEDEKPALTRPGRKSGAAYDWYVGEDGQIIQSETAIVYSGEDEPESVPL